MQWSPPFCWRSDRRELWWQKCQVWEKTLRWIFKSGDLTPQETSFSSLIFFWNMTYLIHLIHSYCYVYIHAQALIIWITWTNAQSVFLPPNFKFLLLLLCHCMFCENHYHLFLKGTIVLGKTMDSKSRQLTLNSFCSLLVMCLSFFTCKIGMKIILLLDVPLVLESRALLWFTSGIHPMPLTA